MIDRNRFRDDEPGPADHAPDIIIDERVGRGAIDAPAALHAREDEAIGKLPPSQGERIEEIGGLARHAVVPRIDESSPATINSAT
uniref:Uncharacterized protein n=1 Tax=viral metagenome TaxID=1070528 RepID=A0A6M3M6K8_9ZZZZ